MIIYIYNISRSTCHAYRVHLSMWSPCVPGVVSLDPVAGVGMIRSFLANEQLQPGLADTRFLPLPICENARMVWMDQKRSTKK